jgi:hypothetical protein
MDLTGYSVDDKEPYSVKASAANSSPPRSSVGAFGTFAAAEDHLLPGLALQLTDVVELLLGHDRIEVLVRKAGSL